MNDEERVGCIMLVPCPKHPEPSMECDGILCDKPYVVLKSLALRYEGDPDNESLRLGVPLCAEHREIVDLEALMRN